jgi:hypothetical protein
MNILQINSSARGNDSESTRVANSIVAKLVAANPGAQVTLRDLGASPASANSTKPPWAPCSPRPTSAAPSRLPAWPWTTP